MYIRLYFLNIKNRYKSYKFGKQTCKYFCEKHISVFFTALYGESESKFFIISSESVKLFILMPDIN